MFKLFIRFFVILELINYIKALLTSLPISCRSRPYFHMQTAKIRMRRRVTRRLIRIQAVWHSDNIFTDNERLWSTLKIVADETFGRRYFHGRIRVKLGHINRQIMRQCYTSMNSSSSFQMTGNIAQVCTDEQLVYCSFHIGLSKAFWRKLFCYFLFLAETFMMCVNVCYIARNEISV